MPRKELPLWEREAGFVSREAAKYCTVVEKWEIMGGNGEMGNGNRK
jgi:hypothetical protein